MEDESMRCVFCDGKTELKHESLNLFDGKLVLKQQPYYKCKKCGEEFVTSQQMRETEKELNAFSMMRPIISTGRSLAVTIPTDLAKFYNLKKGKKVQLIPENKQLLKVKIN